MEEEEEEELSSFEAPSDWIHLDGTTESSRQKMEGEGKRWRDGLLKNRRVG